MVHAEKDTMRTLISAACFLAAAVLIAILGARHGFFNIYKKSWADPQLFIPAVILTVTGAVILPRRRR